MGSFTREKQILLADEFLFNAATIGTRDTRGPDGIMAQDRV